MSMSMSMSIPPTKSPKQLYRDAVPNVKANLGTPHGKISTPSHPIGPTLVNPGVKSKRRQKPSVPFSALNFPPSKPAIYVARHISRAISSPERRHADAEICRSGAIVCKDGRQRATFATVLEDHERRPDMERKGIARSGPPSSFCGKKCQGENRIPAEVVRTFGAFHGAGKIPSQALQTRGYDRQRSQRLDLRPQTAIGSSAPHLFRAPFYQGAVGAVQMRGVALGEMCRAYEGVRVQSIP